MTTPPQRPQRADPGLSKSGYSSSGWQNDHPHPYADTEAGAEEGEALTVIYGLKWRPTFLQTLWDTFTTKLIELQGLAPVGGTIVVEADAVIGALPGGSDRAGRKGDSTAPEGSLSFDCT